MKIRLKNKSTVITPRITEAYNHETKSAVAIEFDGVPGAYETTVEDLNVAADCLVNRGWELVSPPVLSCPVIRNPFGFMHPDEFVFSARAGWLTREQVKEANEKRQKKSASESESDASGFRAESDASPDGGEVKA